MLCCGLICGQVDSVRIMNPDELANVLSKRAGARILKASASDSSSNLWPQNIIDESLGTLARWRGKINKWKEPLDSCFVTIRLPTFQVINSLVFNTNGCNSENHHDATVKSIRVEFSDDSLFSTPKKIITDKLYKNRENQIFTIENQPVKWIKIWILSNYGNKSFFELGRVYAYNDAQISQIQREFSEDGKIDEPIEFKEKSAVIEIHSIPIIEQIAKVLHENPDWQITIEGHTDSQGSATENKKLSENRAKAVLEELVRCGIERKRLSSVGYGLTKPKCPNDTPEGRQCNRRVSFVLKTDNNLPE